jgi:hypothetical protein
LGFDRVGEATLHGDRLVQGAIRLTPARQHRHNKCNHQSYENALAGRFHPSAPGHEFCAACHPEDMKPEPMERHRWIA